MDRDICGFVQCPGSLPSVIDGVDDGPNQVMRLDGGAEWVCDFVSAPMVVLSDEGLP